MYDIKWIGCDKSNFTKGRQIYKPKAIVIHRIDDTMDNKISGTDAWFNNPASRVSAHYAVASSGYCHQYVLEQDTAYHCGRVNNPTWAGLINKVNPNYYTIGIEHEGQAKDNWPEAMLQSSSDLVADICFRYKIPIDGLHIVGHNEIFSLKSCPGEAWNKKGYIELCQTKLVKLNQESPLS